MPIAENMRVTNLRPSKLVAVLLHSAFTLIYLLLIVRAGISLCEGPINLSNLPNNSLPTLLIKRISGILYAPFFAVFISADLDSEGWFIATIIFALSGYALIHYGMFMRLGERSASVLDKILKVCRAVFFLAGTLLLLLIGARMSVMLYQDITYGRIKYGIGLPVKK